ncbi:MAG: nucleoside 2-deoxyribosyltransferase [Bacteroidota bacterium]
MKRIYFAGSIRGGRSDQEQYRKIIGHLQLYGEVLTEHIGHSGLTLSGEKGLSDQEIYSRDMDWLALSDLVVAEVSVPSLGVGFEIASALKLKKQVLCLYLIQEGKKLSAMISGCPDIQVKEYQTLEDVKQILDTFFTV